MNHQLRNYDIYPRIVKQNTNTKITIKPLGDHVKFNQDSAYVVQVLPTFESDELMQKKSSRLYEVNVCDDGTITIEHFFNNEQEHYIRIFNKGEEEYRNKKITQLSVYSVAEDLYELRPYMGDLHIHTYRSDGIESPAMVASYYRKGGFDFMAITDHHRFFPSIEAIEAYKDAPIDILMMTGEEVHPPQNDVHSIHIGGKYSINEMHRTDEEKYRKEVNEIMEGLDVDNDINKFAYASCVWVANNIKKAGGLAIFVHPHWLANVYHVPDKLSSEIFKNNVYEAFELLGGQPLAENEMQVAFYHQLKADGIDIPIVGSSDSHGCISYNGETLVNKTKTMVFAKECIQEDILGAIRSKYSVAIDDYNGKGDYRVHGSYRLVSYTRFLMENYFPFHDELCFEEGIQMKEYALGNKESLKYLELFKGRTKRFMEHCFTNK
jgi:predicted metal-dependent phosphoesterase TrpH